jgi:hypothetical protein
MSCSPLALSNRIGGSYNSAHRQNAAHQNTLELVFGRGVSGEVLGRSTDLMAMARQTGRTDLAVAAHAVAARTRDYSAAVQPHHAQLGSMFGEMEQMQNYQRGSQFLLDLLMQGRGF